MKRRTRSADAELLRRIHDLPINAAHRARASAEYQRADAAAERIAGAISRVGDAVSTFRRSVLYRQHRHG